MQSAFGARLEAAERKLEYLFAGHRRLDIDLVSLEQSLHGVGISQPPERTPITPSWWCPGSFPTFLRASVESGLALHLANPVLPWDGVSQWFGCDTMNMVDPVAGCPAAGYVTPCWVSVQPDTTAFLYWTSTAGAAPFCPTVGGSCGSPPNHMISLGAPVASSCSPPQLTYFQFTSFPLSDNGVIVIVTT